MTTEERKGERKGKPAADSGDADRKTTGLSQPLTPEETEFARDPVGALSRGGTSARETAAPRQKETTNEPTDVVRGFTSTGVTGSTGGRADYGIGEDDATRRRVRGKGSGAEDEEEG